MRISHGWWLMPLVLLGPAAWYVAYYIPKQQSYFTDRNFRLLNAMGEEFKARVDTSVTALKNQTRTARWYMPEGAIEWIESNIRMIPGLELLQRPTVTNVMGLKAAQAATVRVTSEMDAGMRFDCEAIVSSEEATNYVGLQAKRNFSNLITQREEFDAFLLADASRKVLFKQALPGWNALELDHLRDKAGGLLKTNLERNVSTAVEIDCAGKGYRMFLHPVNAGTGTTNISATIFWFCGLVESKRFLAESTAISHRRLAGFGYLTLGVMIIMPFVKLRLMGTRAPLRPKDVFLVSAATLVASGLMAFLLLDLFAHSRTEERFNRDLQSLTTKIAEHWTGEMKGISGQLKAFARLPETESLETPLSDGSGRYMANTLNQSSILKNPGREPYPFFEMLTWVKANGDQYRKWTVRSAPTPFIPVKDREYFNDALAQRHSPYKCSVDGADLWVQPIVSRNTGQSSVVIAVPHTNGVLTMDSKLLSLIRPILPPGFGYAVVGTGGQTLLHSEPARNLQENILHECDNSPALRAALLGGQSGPFTVTYRGVAHTFCVQPLPGSPWTLIGFCDARSLNHTSFDIAVVGLSLLGLYFMAFLVFASASRLFSRKAIWWLWPDPNKSGRYLRVFLLNIGFAALLSIVISFSTELSISALSLAGVSVMAGAFGLVISGLLRKRDAENSTGLSFGVSTNWRYVLMLGSLLLVIGAVPAVGFFKLAHDYRVDVMIEEGQLRMAKALIDRRSRIENEYRSLMDDAQSARRDELMRARLDARQLDLYTSCFFGTTLTNWAPAVAERRLSSFFENALLERLRPLHYRTLTPTHGTFSRTALDTNAWVFHKELGRLTLMNRKEKDAFVLMSTIPALNLQKNAGGIVVLTVIFLGVCCLARFGARQLLALGLETRTAREIDPGSTGEDRLILIPADQEPAHPWLRDPKREHLDLRNADELKRWLESTTEESSGDSKPLVIHYLDHKHQDAEFNRMKLRLMQKLTERNGREIAAVSAVEPTNFNFGAADAKDDAARKTAEDELGRWIAVFEPFARDYGKQAHAGLAGSSYRAVWATCSLEEQLALFQLARYGFVNSRNPELARLIDRGVVVRRPDLQSFEPEFTRFVLKAFRPEKLPAHEQEQAPSAWNDLKKPLWIALIAIALFMFVTQRELFTTTTGVLGTFVAVIPGLIRFLNLFDKEKAKSL